MTVSLPPSEPRHGGGPPMGPEGVPPRADDLHRVGRWVDESREIIGRVIPEVVEDRLHQHSRVEAAEDTCRRLRLETTSLRNELAELQTEARAVRHQIVAIGDSAGGALAQLTEAVRALEEIQQRQPKSPPDGASQAAPPAPSRWRLVAFAGWGATAMLLAVVSLILQLKSTPAPGPTQAPSPAPSQPAAAAPPTDVLLAPEPAAEPKVARVPDNPPVLVRNEIRQLRVVDVSGHEIQVVIDYAYVGDHGRSDIFIHAAALQEGEELRSRVPGTSFPFAPISVGDGKVTISIAKQTDTGPSVSTRVKVCMVSIKNHAAFVCQIFPYVKAWDS